MNNQLCTLDEARALVDAGKILLISGAEAALAKLPLGKWIGATTPYFMQFSGCVYNETMLFITDFTELVSGFKVASYSAQELPSFSVDTFENGFSVVVLPAFSGVVSEFGLHSLSYNGIFDNAILGFVAGVALSQLGTVKARVFDGTKGLSYNDLAVILHLELPDGKVARTEIININTMDTQAELIEFPVSCFTQSDCLIDGKQGNIAQYLHSKSIVSNSRPMMANYNGAAINRDIELIDLQKSEVTFFSPVFNDEKYQLAMPISNYFEKLKLELDRIDTDSVVCTFYCLSYMLLAELTNKILPLEGVFTFGEISYQLLNQTIVYLVIDEK